MSQGIGEARSPGSGPAATLLASRRHTLYFLAIWLAVTVAGILSAVLNPGDAKTQGPNDMIPFYLFLIGMQALWVRFVYLGMRKAGHSPLEFFSLPRLGPGPLARDIGCAVLSYALIYACGALSGHWLDTDAQRANLILPQLPTGTLAVTVWIGLSLSAGICEEIVFRGYLQRQLATITGRPVLAIAVQALLFGIAHAYEGLAAVADIIVIGLILGALVAWRGNIRAAVLVHFAVDVLAGFGLA